MKKIFVVFLIILCAFVMFGRPALSAAVEDERVAFLSFEPASFALPGDIFAVVLPGVDFIREYFEQGQLARCLERYLLTSQERPPPFAA